MSFSAGIMPLLFSMFSSLELKSPISRSTPIIELSFILNNFLKNDYEVVVVDLHSVVVVSLIDKVIIVEHLILRVT